MSQDSIQSLYQSVQRVLTVSSSVADVAFGLNVLLPEEVADEVWIQLLEAFVVRVSEIKEEAFRIVFDTPEMSRCLEVTVDSVEYYKEEWDAESSVRTPTLEGTS